MLPAQMVDETPGALLPGERIEPSLSVRNTFFKSVYDLVEASARKKGAAQGSNFWVLYRNDGQGKKARGVAPSPRISASGRRGCHDSPFPCPGLCWTAGVLLLLRLDAAVSAWPTPHRR